MSDKLTSLISVCIEKNLPFTTFRLPREQDSTTYIQTTAHTQQWRTLHDLSDKDGFIMAPFDTRNGKKYIFIKPDIVVQGEDLDPGVLADLQGLEGNKSVNWDSNPPVLSSRKDYIEQVKDIKNNISRGYFQKAVLSRISAVEGNYTERIFDIYREVCSRHPNAFVYIFKSEEHFWLGASPEPLLQMDEGKVSTVSLAATRPFSEQNMELNNWTMKEVLEQEYVTRYIHDNLRAYGIRDYRVTSPYVKKAGDLVHLRTDFSFDYKRENKHIWEFLDALHPTPAVAGQPKDDAIDYIKRTEQHDREYYTGFLGPVQSNRNIDLFVNLRCMKITPEYLSLYVGGGITLESDPEDEWEETRLKAQSLLNITKLFPCKKEEHNARQAAHS